MPRRPRSRGRPPKVSPEITTTVCNALTALCKHETAANLAGIGLRTFYLWRKQGLEDPQGPYGEFSRAVRGAEAQSQQALSTAVALAARKDGRLALDALRARWPHLWPKEKSRIELSGKIRGELAGLSDEDLARRAEKAAEALRTGGRED